MSSNQERRHLTASQKAAVAVELLPFLEEEARKRQAAAGGYQNPKWAGSHEVCGESVNPKLDEALDTKPKQSLDQAGKKVGVGCQYVAEAKKLQQEHPLMVYYFFLNSAGTADSIASPFFRLTGFLPIRMSSSAFFTPGMAWMSGRIRLFLPIPSKR